MKLKTNTWHCWLWELSFGGKNNIPEKTNLCKYFWRILFVLAISPFFIIFCCFALPKVCPIIEFENKANENN